MKNVWLENNKINLIDVITGNNSIDIIKYILYTEGEKQEIELFLDYEKQVELEDIIYNLAVAIIKEYKEDNEKIPKELIECEKHFGCVDVDGVKDYFIGMSNLDVLKALM